ncbi:cathepsin C, putative [Theileria equi strain WA]|uniref:Dipeptidyl peptidase 1 n=1 Tax=Theileria equi strain WA TaxID=1537102 RepID=L1LCB7_THEEQ|nr:cathepsin C, putative [Theileria equi strain WA]EKX72895.1 cathepsin C, putative [Theileria equi strain WA]|eukprot:XP_004832347.1 cathepsin C, putative [Theileria equi strain WA]
MERTSLFLLINVVLFIVPYRGVYADLPIHALVSDIAGKWTFSISYNVYGADIACGSDTPNSIGRVLSFGDYKTFIEKQHGISRQVTLDLTLETVKLPHDYDAKHRNDWVYLAVKSDNERVIGTWTAIYDQGFYITLDDGLEIFSYVSFSPVGEHKYLTNPNQTQIGWVTRREGGNITHACASGSRVHKKESVATVNVDESTSTKYGKTIQRTSDVSRLDGNLVLKTLKENGGYFCRCTSKGPSTHDLPRAFSWDRYENIPLVNQKRCGGCYTISALYTLQVRFIIQVSKLLKSGKAGHREHALKQLLADLKRGYFDINDALSCIYLNQGCHGGYPYLVGKHAKEYGLHFVQVDGDYTRYESEKDRLETIFRIVDNQTCDNVNSNKLFYAHSYGYVGGSYQCTKCSGEALMMQEIYENGPIVVGIDGSFLNGRHTTGIIDFTDEDAKKRFGLCDVDGHPALSGWEYTTHAVAVIGWGEEVSEHSVKKYWIIRNSWGKDWGDGGFFKLVRGENAFGVESEGVFIDPDLDRATDAVTDASIRHHK